MRAGIESYSYHRLLGEIRPGESRPETVFANGILDVLKQARDLGAGVVSLETCFLGPVQELDTGVLLDAAGPIDIILAWGHPDGLAFGEDQSAAPDLETWMRLAADMNCTRMRVVAASPRYRGERLTDRQIRNTVPLLHTACRNAEAYGISLAIENHADLTADELMQLMAAVNAPNLGVCLDTVNLLRVGDNVLEAVELLAPLVTMVHLKDCSADPIANATTGPVSVSYGEGIVPVERVLTILEERGNAEFREIGPVLVELGQLGPGIIDECRLVADCMTWLQPRLQKSRRGLQ